MTKSRQSPYDALEHCTDRQTRKHIACPVGQQENACRHQNGAEAPRKIAFGGRQDRGGGCEGTDMHGVPRGERIQRAAGERDAMQMAAHGAPVRPHLVKMRF